MCLDNSMRIDVNYHIINDKAYLKVFRSMSVSEVVAFIS